MVLSYQLVVALGISDFESVHKGMN